VPLPPRSRAITTRTHAITTRSRAITTHCLTRDRRVELETQRVAAFLLTLFKKAVSHRAPWREFGGRLARVVDGSPPGLSRRVRNTPATITRLPFPRADRQQRPPGQKNARCSGNAPGVSRVGVYHARFVFIFRPFAGKTCTRTVFATL